MINIFLKNQIKKLSKKHSRYKTFREYNDIRKITLLFDMENLPEVEAFVKTLMDDGKQVMAHSFVIKKTAYPQLSENFHIWHKNNLDFWSIPKSSDIKAFKSIKSDTLIDLTNGSSPVLRYLFLSSSAAFRVGFNYENAQLFDLLIERTKTQDFSFFVNQMLFYMKSLRTK